MPEIDRLSRDTDWIELDFVERQRTPEPIIEIGIRLHLAGLSLPNTKQHLETLGVERSRTAIHNWIKKADLQPTSDGPLNHVAVNETVIQVDDEHHWLYVAVDPATNEFLHTRLFSTRTTQLTVLFLREVREKQHVDNATVLVDAAPHLTAALDRLSLRFRSCRHGNWNAIERGFSRSKTTYLFVFKYVQ